MNKFPFKFFVVGLLSTSVASGCGKKSNGSLAGPSSPPAETKGLAIAPKERVKQKSDKPDFSLDVAAWRADWADPKSAVQKYNGKLIELTGTIDRIVDDPIDGGCIYLKLEGTPGARCLTADTKPWLKVAPGSTIKLRGGLPNALSYDNVGLGDALITDPGPKPVFTTAEQITKKYAADRKAAAKKYEQKWVNLEGKIIDAKVVAGDDMHVKIKGAADYFVICSIKKTGLEGAKPGQMIKAFGQLHLVDAGVGKDVYLYASALTELK